MTPFYIYFIEISHSLKLVVGSVEANVADGNCYIDDGGNNDDDDDDNESGCFAKRLTNGSNSWSTARISFQ